MNDKTVIWNTIFELAGSPECFPDDPVSTEKFTYADVVDTVAEHQSVQWPSEGLFVLKDGRVVLAQGQCSRRGWSDPESRALLHVGSSVCRLFLGRPWGNTRFALFAQFTRWHAIQCARKLIGFLERGEDVGWTYSRILARRGGSDEAAWVTGVALPVDGGLLAGI